MSINIREAQPDDAGLILRFVKELADFEKLLDQVTADETAIKQALFSKQPIAYALIAELNDKAVGFALYFFNYSTFLGKKGIYLEDLYVTPLARGNKVGKALLKTLAQIAIEKNCGRFEWCVLDWNQPAIDFYRSIGAVGMNEWKLQRLDGEALSKFASSVIE